MDGIVEAWKQWDNYNGDVTHGQPIGKQISYRSYKRTACCFNGYFYKEDILDWLLDQNDLFDFENINDERKVRLALYRLRKYALRWWEQDVGGNKYNLIESDKVKTKFVHGQG